MRKVMLLVLCAVLCAAFWAKAGDGPTTDTSESALQSIGGPFILINQDGKTVTDEDFRGQFLLIAFGYTNCPDICPTTLLTMASAINLLGSSAKAVRPLFISLDPARDTPARLKEYVGSFGPSFVGLTGPEPFVASVAEKYRVKYTKVASPSGGYSIDHTAGFFLLGPDGEFLDRFSYNEPTDTLASAIRQRLRSTAQ